MEGQFYVTLPSNSSLEIYHKNTLADFTVHLLQPLDLGGDWVVGLSEIQYPHTWNNVRKLSNVFYARWGKEAMVERYEVSDGYYKSVNQVLDSIKNQMAEKRRNDLVLSYDDVTRRVTIDLKNSLEVLLGEGFAPLLGFENGQNIDKKTISPHVASLAAGFHSLYVYLDIIDAQVVGDAMVPLLRIVNIEGVDGQTITRTFQNPFYVSRKYIDRIQCIIKDDTNQLVPFESGKVVVTLHFKRGKPFYL